MSRHAILQNVARTARVLAANPIPKARLARLVRVHCSAVRLERCYLYLARCYLCIDGTCALQKVGTLPTLALPPLSLTFPCDDTLPSASAQRSLHALLFLNALIILPIEAPQPLFALQDKQ